MGMPRSIRDRRVDRRFAVSGDGQPLVFLLRRAR
jgi:hypothetical protein